MIGYLVETCSLFIEQILIESWFVGSVQPFERAIILLEINARTSEIPVDNY